MLGIIPLIAGVEVTVVVKLVQSHVTKAVREGISQVQGEIKNQGAMIAGAASAAVVEMRKRETKSEAS